jgi:hypothetical protein
MYPPTISPLPLRVRVPVVGVIAETFRSERPMVFPLVSVYVGTSPDNDEEPPETSPNGRFPTSAYFLALDAAESSSSRTSAATGAAFSVSPAI